MDDNTLEFLKLALVGLPGAAAAYYAYRSNKKAAEVQIEQKVQGAQVADIKKQTDGVLEKLGVAKLAEGKAAGKEEAQAAAEVRAADRAAGAADARMQDAAKPAAPPIAPGSLTP